MSGKRYPRDFKLNAAFLVVDDSYSYRKTADRLGACTESLRCRVRTLNTASPGSGARTAAVSISEPSHVNTVDSARSALTRIFHQFF